MDEARLAAAADRVQKMLWSATPAFVGDLEWLSGAMDYALDGGKRIRAALVLESCALCGVPDAAALRAAAGVEAFHAYSLVHDDLPAMDDDDMRRGRPTVHRKYSETLAILTGDALQAMAFECLSCITEVPADRVLLLLNELASGGGADGMVGGQWLDLHAERFPPRTDWTPEQRQQRVEAIQRMKTGRLIRWSFEAGPILGGADRAPFRAYADALGLAFQIRDDLLDVEGTAEATGKAVGKDAARGKATFVDLLGVDGARARAAALVDEAVAALDGFGAEADFVRDLARYVVARHR